MSRGIDQTAAAARVQELSGYTGLLPDFMIDACARQGMITPYVDHMVRETSDSVSRMGRAMSYGLGPCGYDMRLGASFRVGPKTAIVLDPKNPPEPDEYWEYFGHAGPFEVQPNSMVSSVTVETVRMPPDIQGYIWPKSSYVRLGLRCQTTPVEPGFRGTITLQLMNVGKAPVRVWPGEGIFQMQFFRVPAPMSGYAGAYQGQQGVVIGAGADGLRKEERDDG